MSAQEERNLFWHYFDKYLEDQGNPFYVTHTKGGINQAAGNINNSSPMAMQTICCEFKYLEQVVLVQFYINHNVPLYDKLYSLKDQIEKKLGFKVEWVDSGKKSTSVRRIQKVLPVKNGLYYTVIEAFPYILKFIEVFSPYT